MESVSRESPDKADEVVPCFPLLVSRFFLERDSRAGLARIWQLQFGPLRLSNNEGAYAELSTQPEQSSESIKWVVLVICSRWTLDSTIPLQPANLARGNCFQENC